MQVIGIDFYRRINFILTSFNSEQFQIGNGVKVARWAHDPKVGVRFLLPTKFRGYAKW